MKTSKITQQKIDQIVKKQIEKYEELKKLDMPLKGAFEREKLLNLAVAKYMERRIKLKQIIRDPNKSLQERLKAQFDLAKLPRRSLSIRMRNRCSVTGRARAYNRFTGLGRHAFRIFADQGLLPGIKRVSW